ncbi:MAG TPA: HEAT repeat domain-containing protein [bacterium]
MKKLLSTAMIVAILLVGVKAMAIDQDTVDQMKFFLSQPEPMNWAEMQFPKGVLVEGLAEIHQSGIADGDEFMRDQSVWAMGETGYAEFVPTVIQYLDSDVNGAIACFALGKLWSAESVDALIGASGHEDRFVREAAYWGLAKMNYYQLEDEVKEKAVNALNARLEVEDEDWLVEKIQASITYIETGIVTDESLTDSDFVL